MKAPALKLETLSPINYTLHAELARLYRVSEDGRVFSRLDPERPMAQRLTRFKREAAATYYTVDLSLRGKRYRSWVHVLVMLTYMPPRGGVPFAPSIRHMDGNRLNNHVDNLEWHNSRGDDLCPCCMVPLSQSPRFNPMGADHARP